MTIPFKLTIRKNGAAPVTGPIAGGLVVVAGDVIALGILNPSGLGRVKFKIVDFPPEFPCPVGWQEVGGSYEFNGFTPPTFTIQSDVGSFGNYTISGIVDDGTRINVYNEVESDPEKIDDSLGLALYPEDVLVRDTNWSETNQFDQYRQAVAAMKNNWRVLQALVASGGGGGGGTSTGLSLGSGTPVYAGTIGPVIRMNSIRGLNGITASLVSGEVRIDGGALGAGMRSYLVNEIAPNATQPTVEIELPASSYLTAFSLVKAAGSGSGTFAMELWARDTTNTFVLVATMDAVVESSGASIGYQLVHPFRLGTSADVEIRSKSGSTGTQSQALTGLLQYASATSAGGGGGGGAAPLVSDGAQGEITALAGAPAGYVPTSTGSGTAVWAASATGVPSTSGHVAGEVMRLNAGPVEVWGQLVASEILNGDTAFRGATLSAVLTTERGYRLPTPEDMVPSGTSIASVDAGEEWEVYIHALLAAFRYCQLTRNKTYLVSGGDFAFNTNNVLVMNGATIKKKATCAPSTNACYAQSLTNIAIIGPGTFDGTLTGNAADATHGHIIYMQDVDGLVIRDVVFKDPAVTTGFTGAVGCLTGYGYLRNAVLDNVSFGQTTVTAPASLAVGFGWNGTMENVRINGGTYRGQGFKVPIGIDCTSCVNVVINEPTVLDGDVHGILIGYSATNSRLDVTVIRPHISNCKWNAIYLQGEGNYGVKIIEPDIEFCGGGDASVLAASAIYSVHKNHQVIGGEIRDTGYIKGGGTRGNAFPFNFFKSDGALVDGTVVKRSSWGAFYVEDAVDIIFRNVRFEVSKDANGTFYQSGGSIHGKIEIDGGYSSTYFLFGAVNTSCSADVYVHDGHWIGPDILTGTTANDIAIQFGVCRVVICANNEVSGWNGATGGAIAIDGANAGLRDGTSRIYDNYGVRNAVGRKIVSVPAGDLWIYTEPNGNLQATASLSVTGSGSARHHTIERWWPNKIVRSDAAAATGAETWRFGDVIVPDTTAITTDELSRSCTVAGDPGTWKKVIGT